MINKLVLASASPRRKQLLEDLGVKFEIISADIDEAPMYNEKPADYVSRLAQQKCMAVLKTVGEGISVLGSDTSVVIDDRILGKPKNEDQAVEMLMALSGRWHKVLTAVSIGNNIMQETILVESDVEFCTLNEKACRIYWLTQEPQDKAGGYGIQGKGSRFVKQIKGSYSAIVGLPMVETANLLDKFEIPYWKY